MKTVPRNHKTRFQRIWAGAHTCRAYSLENHFHGENCDPRYARQEYVDRAEGRKPTRYGHQYWD